MARITIRVSDLSGERIPDEVESARLIVERHPDFQEAVTLELLPEEIDIATLVAQAQDYVALSYYLPDDSAPQRLVMPLAEFNELFKDQDADAILARALSAQQEEQSATGRRGVRGGRRRQTTETRQRVDYTSPEHAGEPHRGTISEAERVYVQEHLDEVNDRLRNKGMREIDPTDLQMIERYGFTQPEL